MQTSAECNDNKNILSHSTRLVLVKWLEGCADHGLPLVRRVLKEKVGQLLRAEGKGILTVTDSWVDRFLACAMHWNSLEHHVDEGPCKHIKSQSLAGLV